MVILNYNCRVCMCLSVNDGVAAADALLDPLLAVLLSVLLRCRCHLVSSVGLGPVRGKQALFGLAAAGANRTQTVSCEPDGGVFSRDGDDVSSIGPDILVRSSQHHLQINNKIQFFVEYKILPFH